MDCPHSLGKPIAMRPVAALTAAVLLFGGIAAIFVGGGNVPRHKMQPLPAPAAVSEAASVSSDKALQRYSSAEKIVATPKPASATTNVLPTKAPPPAIQSAGLERVEPRAALSELGQALPPRPKMPDEWKGTTLFNPVATAAGMLEAKGYKIALAGIEPVMPDEECNAGGKSWPCGVRARAAFRAWLRGRSIICEVPPQPDRETIVVPCKVGKSDASAWLVESGWARAAADSSYAELADAALEAGKGIYGPPPATTAVRLSTLTGSSLPAPARDGTAILSGPLTEPPPEQPVFVPTQDGPLGEFPKPPAAPTAPAQ